MTRRLGAGRTHRSAGVGVLPPQPGRRTRRANPTVHYGGPLGPIDPAPVKDVLQHFVKHVLLQNTESLSHCCCARSASDSLPGGPPTKTTPNDEEKPWRIAVPGGAAVGAGRCDEHRAGAVLFFGASCVEGRMIECLERGGRSQTDSLCYIALRATRAGRTAESSALRAARLRGPGLLDITSC